jgi:hypothetical protein
VNSSLFSAALRSRGRSVRTPQQPGKVWRIGSDQTGNEGFVDMGLIGRFHWNEVVLHHVNLPMSGNRADQIRPFIWKDRRPPQLPDGPFLARTD